jgi:hypothetical protein
MQVSMLLMTAWFGSGLLAYKLMPHLIKAFVDSLERSAGQDTQEAIAELSRVYVALERMPVIGWFLLGPLCLMFAVYGVVILPRFHIRKQVR